MVKASFSNVDKIRECLLCTLGQPEKAAWKRGELPHLGILSKYFPGKYQFKLQLHDGVMVRL